MVDENLTGVDPAFTAPERPEMYTLNAPAPGEVEALLADRERLATLVAHGLRLWKDALSRQHGDQVVDPLGPQKSREDSRRAWLAHYQWLHLYGPTLLLVIDGGLLDGKAAKELAHGTAA